jgi:hypothetical protein
MAEIEKTVEPAAQEEILETSASPSNTERRGFFPWLEDKERQHLSIRVLRRFPLLGALGLIGSFSTIILSWIVLFCFHNRRIVDNEHLKYLPKPAVWLSVILSMNAIFVHIAVTQGTSVSWWYRASREQATIEDLHNIWAVGSNRFYAVTSKKAFNYVALAAIFVAILPIDGILLQNSVSSTLRIRSSAAPSTPLYVADSFPDGFSATLNGDGTVSTLTPYFQGLISSVIGYSQGVYSYANTPDVLDYDYIELDGTFNVVGFNETCSTYTIPYDLPLDNHIYTEPVSDSIMFSADILWSNFEPNTIFVNTIHKPDDACVGHYIVTNCSLYMASVKQHLVASNQSSYWYWSMSYEPQFTTGPENEPVDFSYSSVPSDSINHTLNRVDNETATVFGGIAKALNSYFQSSVILQYTNTTGTSLSVNGIYADQIASTPANYSSYYIDTTLPNNCNHSFNQFGYYYYTFNDSYNSYSYSTPADDLLYQIRNTLFSISILVATDLTDASQTATDLIFQESATLYSIAWRYWGGTVLVTICILLFILPTYYGFWTLARKTTLSPFETARAFNAPALAGAPVDLDTRDLLKTFGPKYLHNYAGA